MIHRTKNAAWSSSRDYIISKLSMEFRKKVQGYKRIIGVRMIAEKPTHDIIVEGYMELICPYDNSRSLLDFQATLTNEGQLRNVRLGPT